MSTNEKNQIRPEKSGLKEYRVLGNSGILVSRVGFGIHPLGPSRRNLSVEEGADLMCYAYDKGVRFFDTAQFYQTYHYLRAGLEKIRKSPSFDTLPVISSKSLAGSGEEMREAVEEALRECQLDQMDIFLLHQVTPGDFERRKDAWQALKEAKREGLVKAIGISTHHQDVVEEAAECEEIDVVFAMYNYTGLGIRKGDEAGSREGMKAALQTCRKAGKGIYIMKVFGGGNLTGDYQKAAGHIFMECADWLPSAMIGFTDKKEVDELEAFLNEDMPASYCPSIEGKKLRVDREDCMGCGTCVRICASGAMHYSQVDGLAEIDESLCVSCSYCAIACPERAIVFW